MNSQFPTFPTDTAVLIANHAGLLSIATEDQLKRYWVGSLKYSRKEWKDMSDKEWEIFNRDVIEPEMNRLALFQKLSVAGDYKDAVAVAYIGVELTEEQSASLEVIHRYTNNWTKGEIVNTLVTEINNNSTLNGKDKANMAETAVGIMDGGNPGDATGAGGKKVKAFMMELT